MKIEALPGVFGNEIGRHDDARAERDNPHPLGSCGQVSPQRSDGLRLPEFASGKGADARPEERGFRVAHKENDEVVASDPDAHDAAGR